MSGKRNVSVCRGYELANALYRAEVMLIKTIETWRGMDGV